MSSAYRKPDTCWQHHAALNGGVTYSKRAERRPVGFRRIRVAGLLVVIAAIAAALGYQLLASSSSTAASPIDVLAVSTVVFAVSTVVRLARLTVPSPTARRSG